MKLIFLFAFSMGLLVNSSAQKDTIKGLRFGFLPVATYDSDLGLKAGILVTAYQFGDGSLYPDYVYNASYEINRTTKGSGISQLFFDSGTLLKGGKHRIVADFSLIHEQATDFYGFNGAASHYNPGFEDEESSDYISRMYYNFDRKILRITADWHKQMGNRFVFLAGIHHYGFQQSSVDIDKLNNGKDAGDLLPDTFSLYDYYIERGIITSKQADGGNVTALRTGLVFDTRDAEFNPVSGSWLEAIVTANPAFPWVESPFVRASVILRNYLPVWKKRITVATRLGWQDNLGKQAPFYFMPYLSQSYCNNSLVEGLGGGKTLRGILRNRIWGDGFVYGNIELRMSLATFKAINQKIEIKFKPFFDFGMITDLVDYELKPSTVLHSRPPLNIADVPDKLHGSSGAGIHFVMNDNFILSIDYGKSLNANDGNSGLYIGTGFLF